MLLKEDDAFLLDIRSDQASSSPVVSETAIHRKIIDLFKCRDEFTYIDLHINTPRGLSGTTRVDLANALAHLRTKCGKTLRKLSADLDYMDPSVHEFVLLQCLNFQHISLTSNPEFEQTHLSVGLAMSLQHALTLNGTQVLDLTCALSEPVSELLAEAMRQSTQLKEFKLHLLAPTVSSLHIGGILEGLKGKSTLETLHLRDVQASVSSSLAKVLGDSKCRVRELSLSYDWEFQPSYNTHQLCQAFEDMAENGDNCESVKTLLLDGIPFEYATKDDEEDEPPLPTTRIFGLHFDRGTNNEEEEDEPQLLQPPLPTTRVLPLAFPNLETLSIAAPRMPKLAFLELPPPQLPHQLQHVYFPCPVLDVEQARNLVEVLPNVTDIPDFQSDPVVEHLLDWRKVLDGNTADMITAALWPHLLERTNTILENHPRRRANMLYTLMQHYYGLQRSGQLVFPEQDADAGSEEEEAGDDAVVDVKGDDTVGEPFTFDEAAEDGDY